MPLFESQKGRNERLLVLGVGQAFLKSLNAWLTEEGVPNELREYYRVVYEGWFVGGSGAAGIAVSACKSLKDAWGKGDERKAYALAQVFTLAMISRWYRRLDEVERPSHAVAAEARRIAASNVLTLFGDHSDEAVARFTKLDAQLNYDNDRNEDENRKGEHTLAYALLRAMAEEACGGSRVQLGSVAFPWEGTFEALEKRGVHLVGNFFDNTQIAVALHAGAAVMFEFYDKWYKVPNTHES